MDGTNMSWLWGALIGAGGTLLGTFFGWLLSKPKNKKINVILNKPICLFEERSGPGTSSLKQNSLVLLRLNMELVFYNPSDNMKLMRNTRVTFYAPKRKKLFSLRVFSLLDMTTFSGSLKNQRSINAINIPPHAGELIKCEVALDEERFKVKDTIVKAYLVFDDEKDKTVSQPIILPDLKSIKL